MEAASKYLEMNCFERLSRPIVKKNEAEEEFDVNEDDDDDKSSVLDMDTFMTRTNKKNPKKVLSIDRTVFETTRATFDNETEKHYGQDFDGTKSTSTCNL